MRIWIFIAFFFLSSCFFSAGPRPKDSELPSFDPENFKPGQAPPIVKKGEEEYMIVVSGIKDTGLCGKYWSDMETLPSKRRRTTVAEQLKVRTISTWCP